MAEQIVTEVEYRDIPFTIDGYRVGSDGTIWSCWAGSGFGLYLGSNWKKLKLAAQREGHLHFDARLRGREHEGQKHILVHRTVLLVFRGPCPEGMEACHDDGNPQNNVIGNLRWDTPKANQKDRERHGTANIGTQNPAAVLTEEQVREIRRSGGTQAQIASRFNVSQATIYLIKARKTWKSVA